jgi:hypothetical protein
MAKLSPYLVNEAVLERDFSIILGGPLYHLFIILKLLKPPMELVFRRVLAISLFTWLPVAFFFASTKTPSNIPVSMTFFYDIEFHVRFLIALPTWIAAEAFVHNRMAPIIQQFEKRSLIPDESRWQFILALSRASTLRNSIKVEAVILLPKLSDS